MIRIMIPGTSNRVTKIICVAVSLFATAGIGKLRADDVSPGEQAKVQLNANLAGCVKPSIINYSIGEKDISASLKIEKDNNFSEGPCVCRGGLYYFLVFASDKALPKDRAWMYAKSFYKADLAFGVLPAKPYEMPHSEVIRFPALRKADKRLFSWYYVAIGCP